MSAPLVPLPAVDDPDWDDWALGVDTTVRSQGYVFHNGTTGGGTRPTGYTRVRWIGGSARPTNMAAGDVWEHDV